ncbi:DNA-3-methyladenine glycosylase 2 family protein [Candidatus Woesebacteria bacterium]|nr:DNA-3-methyladenine glycosylase 2 family protein [Candidatus Woesebacteria bacterium]
MRKYFAPEETKFKGWGEAEKFLSKDKYLSPIIARVGSCTIKPSKPKDYFFDLVDSIISQQLSGKAAGIILNRVRGELGSGLSPTILLKTDDEKLRNCGLSWAKVKYIKDLAQKIEGEEVNLEKLDKLEDEEIVSELVKVKGIGRWTAEMFLMFSLARPDVFPIDDLGIKKGINKLFKKEILRQEIEEKSNRWKPFRTAASWYVWALNDNK